MPTCVAEGGHSKYAPFAVFEPAGPWDCCALRADVWPTSGSRMHDVLILLTN